MRGLPLINGAYWLALVAASIFGTNTGDLISEYFHLGNVAGLPYLLAGLAAIFLIERVSPWITPVFFWAAIIVIRTAATNIADATHMFGVYGAAAVPALIAAFVVAVRYYKQRSDRIAGIVGQPKVDALYWLCMALAGITGTLVGDFGSGGLAFVNYGVAHVLGVASASGGFDFSWMQTGHVAAMVVFGGAIAVMLRKYSIADLATPYKYWILLALIRTAGTAAGDYLAHTGLGLYNCTILTGLCFGGMVAALYVLRQDNQVNRSQTALAA